MEQDVCHSEEAREMEQGVPEPRRYGGADDLSQPPRPTTFGRRLLEASWAFVSPGGGGGGGGADAVPGCISEHFRIAAHLRIKGCMQ
eukprot:CAMPEP_0183608940 /NCGR_PEP_ID=MMETSP0371-20130417/184212_1 /TAXON_ID=268820 /ORGANISM="Peridinium aciculiferum, Strain PAER-2" /LENGTH=86 /DNA_ID=CAMNT_0025821067 /DNA_START=1 /DNA_END=261 /DNA_ORIENTATION=-